MRFLRAHTEIYESGSFRPDDLFAPGRFAPLTCSPRVVSPRKVSRFAPLNCYYIIIDEVFFDNFLIIIYLLASCCGFSYYYRFSDIAISSVNPSFISRLEFFKEWLVKYFFVHKIVFKAILVF